ncbi:MAG: penicillin-binding transpeptidase domain-containing protein, partial [Verrucomicrobiales bacterium]
GRARSEKTVISGKTGTAQAFLPNGKKDNNAWFVGFAPFDEPELAICVMVQNGKSGGGVAAPIAAKIIEESLAIEHGYDVPLQVVAEATGNFDHLDYVTFDENEEMESTFEDADTGTQVEVEDFLPAMVKKPERVAVQAAAPSIEPEADAAGSIIPRAIRFFNPGNWRKKRSSAKPSSSDSTPKKRRGLFRR